MAPITKSLFGTEEHIIEYDFTAGSDAEAAAARQALEAKVQQSLTAASLKDWPQNTNPPTAPAAGGFFLTTLHKSSVQTKSHKPPKPALTI